jgi:hypothetical protein
MHVNAIGAAIDLRDAKVDEVDQGLRQAALADVTVDGAERLYAGRCRNIAIDALSHLTSPKQRQLNVCFRLKDA